MLKVGITGNIGSGKTFVCKIFEAINIPIYYADDRAKYLMQHDPKLIKKIKYLFGPQVYVDGMLNRGYLANIVFNDKEKLNQLNKIVHPAIRVDGDRWFDQQEGHYAIKEAALLVETGGYHLLDALIVVTAPESLRIERVMQRDSVTEEQVSARIKNQLSEAEKTKVATYIVKNNGQEALIPQIYDIHQRLINT
ncbi:UNVERIFIED_CONTAM: hypothetical protein GTU68_041799 [Idotea baltica]|nr:hypothetical protein [Idotea baltica]